MTSTLRRSPAYYVGLGQKLLASVVVGLCFSGCGPRTILEPFSYWVVDDRTIGVLVVEGPNRECHIVAVSETPAEVKVSAECQVPTFSIGSTGAGYRYEFEVDLADNLGEREVVDGAGRAADHCTVPKCL